jgi:hypothetical protein
MTMKSENRIPSSMMFQTSRDRFIHEEPCLTYFAGDQLISENKKELWLREVSWRDSWKKGEHLSDSAWDPSRSVEI